VYVYFEPGTVGFDNWLCLANSYKFKNKFTFSYHNFNIVTALHRNEKCITYLYCCTAHFED